MSIPIKELQALAKQIPPNERPAVKRFMEFVIAGAEAEQLSAKDAAAVDKAKAEMKQGRWVSHDEVRKLAGL